MGLVKSEWMEYQERGWAAPEDKFVCADCVEDAFLKNIISQNLTRRKCDYCGKGSRAYIAAPVEVIMKPIASAFFYYFNEPTDAGVPYDGGFIIESTSTEDALLSLPLDCNDNLFEDITNSFAYMDWVPSASGNWAASHPSEIMVYAWERFISEIKHKVRFFFSTRETDPYNPDGSPVNILSTIGNAVRELGLIQIVPVGTVMFRVRERSSGATWPLDADQLGAPPKEIVQAQRMNPSGISYLYLAREKETALAEVMNKPPCTAAVATFTVKRNLWILDLSLIPAPPSIFDEEKRYEGEMLRFLDEFVREISKPVSKDGREHIDYIPSQVVCEYFAKVLRTEDNNSIDGLAYPSAIRPGGTNVVLFPPDWGRDGFKELVEWGTAQKFSFDNWMKLTDAIR